MTKQKKTRNDNKKYGEGGYDWVFLLHVTDWRIMKGIPPPHPLPPHSRQTKLPTHEKLYIKLDSRMYMSAEWNVAETIVSEVVL